ncbi:unnamed protein product [Cyprideis torosa]|uniref:Uncharacterized protein n=1 Tax=Cyprideis torosa TaxID=163714 RepID=A0A7R8ZPW1_9CRUS|nr:unnamed protein product [Cyprideis torosa]CAG0899860.1 unnamed protein product [Cyprideis torosa]
MGAALSSQCRGCLVTASSGDGLVKVWDYFGGSGQPEYVGETELGVGTILSLCGAMDEPFNIAVGGDNKKECFRVWDVRNTPGAAKRFNPRPLKKVQVSSSPLAAASSSLSHPSTSSAGR